MVEYDAVVEKAELGVWKVQVVLGFLGEFFPVSDCVVGYVADCTSDESEFAVGNCFVFNEFFDYVEGVACFFFGGFACFLVADFGVAVFCFDGYGGGESYEAVLCQFFWAFDGF